MYRYFFSLLLLFPFCLAGCGGGAAASYTTITAEAARQLMDTEPDCIILDVRTAEEFADGHIPGALLIPHDTIEAEAGDKLPDKAQLILVYCRSGRRSKNAAAALAGMGYTNVKEFGGILDWPYETVK